MKTTTALRKITALKKKIRAIQGGQGAGKTIAILMLLCNHASANAGKEIIVASAELTKMRLTVIKDFKKVMQGFGIWEKRRFVNGTEYRFPNGSFIKFIGLDKEDIGKGLRVDVIYFNELDKIPWETYREAASRTKNIYIDYNPNLKFYAHTEIIPRKDCDFVKLTFWDNEYLPEPELQEILNYHIQGYGCEYDPDESTPEPINKYWANLWRVYGLGEVGILQGAVYDHWEIVDDLPRDDKGTIVAKFLGFGVDWGWAKPGAIVAIFEYDGKRYWDEVMYREKMSNEDVADAIKEYKIENALKGMTYADQAEPKSIKKVKKLGVRITGADKGAGSLADGIKEVHKYPMMITKRSTNVLSEVQGYVWAKTRQGESTGEPVKKNDHIMDAGRYVYMEAGKYSGEYVVG